MYKLNDFAEVVEINKAVDALCPRGHVGRSAGLFCSVSISEMTRWVHANLTCNYPHKAREITYKGSEPWVYPIALFEIASSDYGEAARARARGDESRYREFEEKARAYWLAGVPLREFVPTSEGYWRSGHEILIDGACVDRTRAVSWKRLMANTTDSERLRVFADQHRRADAARRRELKAKEVKTTEILQSASY
jgi:hypothetical protein